MVAQDRTEIEIAGLGDLDRSELSDRWRAIYGVEAPKGARRAFLERAIAWHIQAKIYGGLKKDARRLLAAAVARSAKEAQKHQRNGNRRVGSDTVPPAAIAPDSLECALQQPEPGAGLLVGGNARAARRLPSTGMRLIREWHGRTHIVDVVDGGYVWQGHDYRSLSVIARSITGARWSGPRFFGL